MSVMSHVNKVLTKEFSSLIVFVEVFNTNKTHKLNNNGLVDPRIVALGAGEHRIFSAYFLF